MLSFEKDLKLKVFAVILPAVLLPVVVVISPKDPYVGIAAALAVLGGILVISAKVIKKFKTRESVEWGSENMSSWMRWIYSTGYTLLLLGCIYAIYVGFFE